MKTATEIVRPAPYGRMHVWCEKHQCRHPIDKPCDASIEAYRLEFEAELKEKDRQRKKRERANPNKNNDGVQDAPVENIATLMPRPEDEVYFQDEEDGGYTYTPMDARNDTACRVRGFIYRAQRSVFAAEADSLKNLACTKEMREAADAVISAWTKKPQQMERQVPRE